MTRDEISLNAALKIMAEIKRPHIGGIVQLTAAIQCIVNTALDREREECAVACEAIKFNNGEGEACAEAVRVRGAA